MNETAWDHLQAAQRELQPQFQVLRSAVAAVQHAAKLASAEKVDALAMQKALVKLQQAAAAVPSTTLQSAAGAFADATQQALDALAFEFARDLKEAFEQRGQPVEGRPPTLAVDGLLLQMDIAGRKAQWFYGKEPLTRPLPLSISTLVQAYDQWRKAIMDRTIDVHAFVAELYKARQDVFTKRGQRSQSGRANLVDVYSQVVLNRQSARFWNAPSRTTFKDYERHFFVRDLLLAHAAPTVTVDGKTYLLRLNVATKNQTESASRSMWLPHTAVDGEYYASLTFAEVS